MKPLLLALTLLSASLAYSQENNCRIVKVEPTNGGINPAYKAENIILYCNGSMTRTGVKKIVTCMYEIKDGVRTQSREECLNEKGIILEAEKSHSKIETCKKIDGKTIKCPDGVYVLSLAVNDNLNNKDVHETSKDVIKTKKQSEQ